MRGSLTDEEIIALYFARDEQALDHTRRSHGQMIYAICKNILHSREDAEECESDVYFAAWKSIPPQRPHHFAAFLARLAHNTAIDRLRRENREKRAGDRQALPFSELDGLVGSDDVSDRIEARELSEILNRFLSDQPKDKQLIFTLRYFHEESLSAIGKALGISKPAVWYKLCEMKKELEKTLEKEGYAL